MQKKVHIPLMKHIRPCLVRYRTLFLLIVTGILVANHSVAQTWADVGVPGFSTGDAHFTMMALDKSGTPYVVFEDSTNGHKATVMKYDGASWVTVGSPGFSAGWAYYTSIAIDTGGTPYVVYEDAGYDNNATVMKFNGSNWVSVGVPGFTSLGASYTSIAIDGNGVPYVFYQDGSSSLGATVMKFNGAGWVTVGTPGFSGGLVTWNAIAINESGVPYVAYEDGIDGAVTVKMFDSRWVTVGSAGFTDAKSTDISIAISGSGIPYVAYSDLGADDGYSGQATVMSYTGTTWSTVGSPGFSTPGGWVATTSIAIDGSGTPYVGFVDNGIGQKASVWKFNGVNWASMSSGGISTSQVSATSIALDNSGSPYIAYSDMNMSNKVTVMKFNNDNGIRPTGMAARSIEIFPNPSPGTFTLTLLSPTHETAQITIINTLGEKIKDFSTTTNQKTNLSMNVPPGVYFITAVTKGDNLTSKIIVQ